MASQVVPHTLYKRKSMNKEDIKFAYELADIPSHLQQYIKLTTRIYGQYKVFTYTVQICNNKGVVVKRNGIDDYTYQFHPELLKLVPRGFSILTKKGKKITEVRGVTKFDGTSVIDEDENTDLVEQTSLIDMQVVTEWAKNNELRVEWQEKANGKFFVFTLFKDYTHNNNTTQQEWYIFGGSKNVHIPHCINQPITSTELHHVILKNIITDLNRLDENQLLLLENRSTIGEYVDGMHIVWCDTPYLVYFNTLVSCNLPTVKKVFPDQSYLPTVDQLRYVRSKIENSEGAVINYINTTTGQTFRQKHKTNWYVIIRTWRELISGRRKEETKMLDLVNALVQRTVDRNNQFLHMDKDDLDKWCILADLFARWLYSKNYPFNSLSPFSNVGMARIWNEFTRRNNTIDNRDIDNRDIENKTNNQPIENEMSLSESILRDPSLFVYIINLLSNGNKVLVAMSGLPGSGKTTITNMLLSEASQLHITAAKFSTDDLFMTDGKYNFNVKMLGINHKRNLSNCNVSTARLKIVDNTNIALNEFSPYFAHARTNGYVCVLLQTNVPTLESLSNPLRNTHNVPLDHLRKKMKQAKYYAPSYYGIFISSDSLPKEISYTQTTPLHVTHEFIGGDKETEDWVYPTIVSRIGQTEDMEVPAICNNIAGKCLLVNYLSNNGSTNSRHITLITNPNYTPFDVGVNSMQDGAKITELSNHLILHGVFGPMW